MVTGSAGQVRWAGTGARRADIVIAQMVVGHAQQVPLDLSADDAGAAARAETRKRPAQEPARGEMKRPAVAEILIANQPSLAPGSTRKVVGSATTVRLGEPVISSSPIPPPRVNDAKTRVPAESSVVVATPML